MRALVLAFGALVIVAACGRVPGSQLTAGDYKLYEAASTSSSLQLSVIDSRSHSVERNMPLGFHAGLGMERAWEGMNRFISVHALGFTWFNIVHMTNMLINGIPERFPKLKIIWIESGLAWLPFLMQRLDNEYMMRTSEAPLLKMKPSEYMANRFYYTSQPIENTNLEALQFNLKMINAEKTLLFASDFPHWDFNLPSTIYDLPFLSEQAKRNILGETARQVYNLEV